MSEVILYNTDCRNYIESIQYKELLKTRDVIIVTDPPFNIGYHYKGFSDRMKEGLYLDFISTIIKGKKCVLIHYPEDLYKIALKIQEVPEKVVSWVYNSNTAKQHRDIAFFNIKPDFRQVRQAYKNQNDKRIQKLIESGKEGGRLYDFWYINQVKNVSKEKTEHPCQMPQEVLDNIIGILPKNENTIIFDPFTGSGTTALACKKYGLDFVGAEISKEYYDIAKERIERWNS